MWAYDFQARDWRLSPVLKTFRYDHDGPVATVRVGADEVAATGGHPFWVARGENLDARPHPQHAPVTEPGYEGRGRWVLAQDLRPGDVLVLCTGEEVAVGEVTVEDRQLTVYNVHVAVLENYAAGPMAALVHNSNDFPLNTKAPGSIGIPGATRLSEAEQATAARLQALLPGRTLKESPHVGAEYVDDLGRSFDQLGSLKASQHWNEKQFLKSIDSHLLKSNTFTVIDLTGFTPAQIAAVSKHLAGLSTELQAKIIKVGF